MAFLLLGKPLIWSFSLAILAGIAMGWIITGWQSKELPNAQKFTEELADVKEGKEENQKENKPEKQQPKKSRHQPKKSWFFWKNARRPPKKSR
ncbi:hypothetical protein [Floridanema aerugineum]|uniref:ATP synthase F0 subunit 8 n=1 Tax=Floridaenema aerugineum BLCC-F46 TaxID=3153654 RepID=A0ABV4X810_9CYAN